MHEGRLQKLLELVVRELRADDARIELGGREPDDERAIWRALPRGWKVVAWYDEPPDDRDALQQRLGLLLDSFTTAIDGVSESPPAELSAVAATRRLDDELESLAVRAEAVCAVVIDDSSPVLWGTSTSRESGLDVDSALDCDRVLGTAAAAGVDLDAIVALDEDRVQEGLVERGLDPDRARHLGRWLERLRSDHHGNDGRVRVDLLASQGIAAARGADEREPGNVHGVEQLEWATCLVRSFASIYLLVLVFEGSYSELRAEGAVAHALPVIEKLVLALPPIEPPPRGAKVVRLPRR